MAAEDILRRDRVLAQARADRAEARLREVRLDRDLVIGRLDRRDAEIARLQGLIAAQGLELARLRQQVAELEAMTRRATLDAMLAGVAGAVANADRSLTDRTITAASAELRVALAASGEGRPLTVATPAVTDPSTLSTVAMQLRTLPPSPAAEEAHAAVEEVRAALGELQAALAGELPRSLRPAADRALAAASLAAADPELAPATAALRLGGVLAALDRLGARRRRVGAAAAGASQARDALASAPTASALRALAAALRAAAREVGG